MTNSHYLKHVFSISLIFLTTIASINYLVNPFSIINTDRIKGLNEIKPQSSHRIGTFKKYQPVYFQPKTILVGNSRVEMGLDPKHDSFKKLQPVYNLGVPGPAVRGQLSYAQNVVDKSIVKNIILSLDYRDFLDEQETEGSTLLPLELNEVKDKVAALLSLDSLLASVITLLNQKANAPNRLVDGFNPANEYREIIKFEGQNALFEHQLKLLNRKLKGKLHDSKRIQREILLLDKKISEWLANDIEVMLFINPYHHDYYTTLEEHKLLISFNLWKDLIRTRFSGKLKFCDFSSLGYKKSKDVLIGDELRYFWEPTHYKKELGDIMIPMILSGCQSSSLKN
jgi:hypothetical protein